MRPLRRLILGAAVLVVAAAVATGSETPWHTPSSSSSSSSGLVAGTPHRVPADQAGTRSQAEGVAREERNRHGRRSLVVPSRETGTEPAQTRNTNLDSV